MAAKPRCGASDYVQRPIPFNVKDAAKIRIKDMILSFDKVVVSFSGGKDSLVVLRLMEEVYREMGIKSKIAVAFYDEEFLPMSVINYVKKVWDTGRYDFKYLAPRLSSEQMYMGRSLTYTKWDTNREWVRPMMEGAITSDDLPFDMDNQTGMSRALAYVFNSQNICTLLGLRAQESLNRKKGVASNTGRCDYYTTSTPGVKRSAVGRPIYDWTEFDVFKYLDETGGDYCPFYDAQMFAEEKYRVATPLHGEAIRHIEALKVMDPWLFDRCCAIFPNVATQARYGSESLGADHSALDKYPPSFDGIRQYIRDTLAGHPDRMAEGLNHVNQVENRRRDNLRRTESDPLGGYPILYVFQWVIEGVWKRGVGVLPMSNRNDRHYTYEGVPVPPK